MGSIKQVIYGLLFAACSALPLSDVAAKKTPQTGLPELSESGDAQFLALRDAARSANPARVQQLAEQLEHYSIPSYVDYYRLRVRLLTASEREIRDYLQRYQGSAIADRLRNDWLLELGRRREWALFDEQYPQFELNDDLQLKCHDLTSRALKGQRVADDARALLIQPRDYGDACAFLIATLAEKQQFTQADLWAQMRLMGEYGVLPQARRLAPVLGLNEKQVELVFEKPALVLAHGVGAQRYEHELYVVALGRVARSNRLGPTNAAMSLERAGGKLPAALRAQGWAEIALPAAQSLAPEALEYWRHSQGARLSPEAAQWKVRTALRHGNFAMVKQTIEAMPAELRAEAAWVYWLARALMAEAGGQDIPATAQALLRSLSEQHHFYGQLALEELGQKITIPPAADKPSATELAQARNNPGLRRAMKFFAMGLRFEGIREWNWELRRMNERQLLAAAEFARQQQLLDRMVNTSDRTRTEFDFQQRFPAPHLDVMHSVAENLGLDKAWAYGLIRQESRFILNARSTVGASGLMQLMPATAQWVANKIGMRGFSLNQVNEIDTNITLGANYLQIVLKGLDNSQTLASAGYNAGPGRPKAWRASLPRAVEGAIFAESIPFLETRTYVKNVLSNATYYAALFEKKPQSLKARLGTVSP